MVGLIPFVIKNETKNIPADQLFGLLGMTRGEKRGLSTNSSLNNRALMDEAVSEMETMIKRALNEKLQEMERLKNLMQTAMVGQERGDDLRYRDMVLLTDEKNDRDGSTFETGYGKAMTTRDPEKRSRFRIRMKALEDAAYASGTRANYPSAGLKSLRRNRVNWRRGQTRAMSTFCQPLAMYEKLIEMCASDHTLQLLRLIRKGVEQILSRCEMDENLFHCCDDQVRSFLSDVDQSTFVESYRSRAHSQVLTSLHGLSTMGGPRGWVEEEVHGMIKDWVEYRGEYGTEEAQTFLASGISEMVDEWSKVALSEEHLSFDEYVTDPMRWATSGGAPAVSISGQKIRSKWAWALSVLESGENMMSAAKKTSPLARVALKEEKKLRAVITTPLPSYLRQCYILYRFGKAPIRSTISDSSLVERLGRANARWYMSIDASEFDRRISKAEVLSLLANMRSKVGEGDDLYGVMTEEMDDLKELKVEYEGTLYPYENGLLSGWRMTSLMGSMHSEMLCRWLKEKTGSHFDYVVQGDDVILYGDYPLEKTYIIDLCEQYGIKTHPQKTSSSEFGEFLKYRYSREEVSGYAARAVRSIFYANPWLDTTIDSRPQEVASKWWTVISRIMVSSNVVPSSEDYLMIKKWVASDVHSWSGGNVPFADVLEAVDTPMSMGGLGVIENRKFTALDKLTSYTRMEVSYPDEKTRFHSLFSNLKGMMKVEKKVLVHKQRMDVLRAANIVTQSEVVDFKKGNPRYENNVNILRSVLESVGAGRSIRRVDQIRKSLLGMYIDCTVFYPRYLRKTSNWYERMKSLLSSDDIGAPPSLFGGFRYCGHTTDYIRRKAQRYMSNLRSIVPGTKWIMAGFSIAVFLNSRTLLNSL